MTIAAALIQPPLEGSGHEAHANTVTRGFGFAERAIAEGARIVCFPEYFGVAALEGLAPDVRAAAGERVLEACRELVVRTGVVILCPTVEFADDGNYNTTHVLRPEGEDRYRKTHLTLSERERHGLSRGDSLDVFELDGVRAGVATCYDMYFPETARVLALAGARVIFFPALQRAEPRESVMLQVRARAYDNCVMVARVAYGYPEGTAAHNEIFLGGTCVADWEGRIIADLGLHEGFLRVELPENGPPPRRRSFDGDVDDPLRYLFEDRRPELYGTIVNPVVPAR